MKKTEQKIYNNKGNIDVLNEISTSNNIILDIGCGGGDNAKILFKNNNTVDGITLSEIELKEAQPFLRKGYIQNLESGLPHLTEKYDIVICSHVIEHIAYPEKLLRDIKSILKEDGKFIVALPNVMHYKSRIELLKGNFSSQESGIWDNTHLRWYTFLTAQKLLTENGFIIKKAWVSGEFPFLTVFKFIPSDIRKKMFNGLTKISKGFFGSQLLYLVQKK